MKKIRSYTSIWNVEKVLYAINDVNLPFPVTFTQITWFVLTEFIIILFADLPPLSMIEGAFLKYFGIPVALTWFMSQKTFDGKKPYSYIKTMVLYSLDCQHFFRQIFLGYFSDIVQAFDTLRKNVCGDDYTSLHNPIVLSSVLPAYGMFHSIQILFL